MKRITLILDGSADRPNAALMNKTPLAAANTPNLDALAQKATKLLRVKTIPDGLEIGSAVANMGLLGLDPHMYRGRAALEAAAYRLTRTIFISAQTLQPLQATATIRRC